MTKYMATGEALTVRSGSEADITRRMIDVRYMPTTAIGMSFSAPCVIWLVA
jgi:hypothetical protein